MNTKFSYIPFFVALLLALTVRAWDALPDAEGLYDGLYDRPTYFPEWEQPDTWENAMYILCDVRELDADGRRVPSYEVAVYDLGGNLRHCGRSLAKQDHYCILTIRGEDGVDEFHFQVLYGNDFARPTIVDIEDIIVPFQTNQSIGSKEEPFMLLVPEIQTGVEMTTHDPALKGGEKILRNGSLFILRNGRMYNVQGFEM